MRDQWYGDDRDLLKWGTLIHIARRDRLSTILQLALYRSNAEWPPVNSLQGKFQIPAEVTRHFRNLFRGSTTQGRAVLQRVINGRIVFTPRDDGGYDFSAETRFDRLFSGVVVPMPDWLKALPPDTRGIEGIGPEDTPDGDYGRLLERVYSTKKGYRARQDSNLRPSA